VAEPTQEERLVWLRDVIAGKHRTFNAEDVVAVVGLLDEARAEVERLKRLLPPQVRGQGVVGEGSWAVYAEKVQAERDDALELSEARRRQNAHLATSLADARERAIRAEAALLEARLGREGR